MKRGAQEEWQGRPQPSDDWTVATWRRFVFNDWLGQATSYAQRQAAQSCCENLIVGVRYVPRRWNWIVDRITGNTWPVVWVCLDRDSWVRFDERAGWRPRMTRVEPGYHELEVVLSRDDRRLTTIKVEADSVHSILLTQDGLSGQQRPPRFSSRRSSWANDG